MQREKILVVDDDQDILNLIKIYLHNENYEVVPASDGRKALEIIDDTFHLVLLDVMMPKMNGIDTCAEIRKNYRMPIIFLTAKGEDRDKFTGFAVGADDYIVKPFNSIELVARIKANLRRYLEYGVTEKRDRSLIKINDLEIDSETHKVLLSGKEISLTKTEFAILQLLAENRGIVFNIEKIYDRVWGEDVISYTDNTVAVHIRKLRQKLERDSKNPEYIKTIWGVGYKID